MLLVKPSPTRFYNRKTKAWEDTGIHGYDAYCGPIKAWSECPLAAATLAMETWLDSEKNGYKDASGVMWPRFVVGGQ